MLCRGIPRLARKAAKSVSTHRLEPGDIMGQKFKDQVVIVTGGGRGIGRAIALEFAAEGAVLLLGGRRMDALQTSVRECRESGGRAESIKCDVAVDEDLQAMVTRAMDHYGRIDVLVNNAGVATGGRLDEIAADD